jgi:ABC-type transport system involved in multi-copper enzyme maturation permease subunit
MKALLRKDLRIYRGAIVAAVVLVCAPYVIGMMVVVWQTAGPNTGRRVGELMGDLAGAGLVATLLLAAIFGGCSFAMERREGWGQFLTMMPVSRSSIVLSKASIALVSLFVVWIIQASLDFAMQGASPAVRLFRFEIGFWGPGGLDLPHEQFYFSYVVSLAGVVLTFGVSWLMSILLESPSIAACAGLGALIACFVQLQMDVTFLGLDVLVAAAFAAGVFCFWLGTILYLERVGF